MNLHHANRGSGEQSGGLSTVSKNSGRIIGAIVGAIIIKPTRLAALPPLVLQTGSGGTSYGSVKRTPGVPPPPPSRRTIDVILVIVSENLAVSSSTDMDFGLILYILLKNKE